MAKSKQKERRKFSITTVFYHRGKVVRINKSSLANNAVPRSVFYMQTNRYDATTAEVFDEHDGVLHAVITRNIQGNIKIVFKREVAEGM